MLSLTRLFSILFVLVGSLATMEAQPAHANDYKEGWKVIHVALDGSDANDGSFGKPYATIAKAFDSLKLAKSPVRIVIEPGTYREGALRIGRRDWPTVVESAGEDQVIISGSDVWTDWTRRGNTLVADWPYEWGETKLDASYPQSDHDAFRPLGRRSEMVFVDGELLTQVTDASEMEQGTYMVDEHADELIVRLPKGKRQGKAIIEVGIRPNLFGMYYAKDVTLRRLTFQHAVSHTTRKEGGAEKWAVVVFGEHKPNAKNYHQHDPAKDMPTFEVGGPERIFAEQITFEDCRFIWNNRTGLAVANTKHFTAKRCNFDDNGIVGVGANRGRYFAFEGCSFDRNNWRFGKLGHIVGWGPAGTKMLFMSDMTITRSSFNNNYATGLWMDTAVNHLVVDDSEMIGNWGVGFYYEHNQGPAIIKNSLVERNGFTDGSRQIHGADGGILFAEAENLTVDNCIVKDNVNFQIAARARHRPGVGYWCGRRIDGACRNLTVRNSQISGSRYDGANVPSYFKNEHRVFTLVGRQVHSREDLYVKYFLPTYRGSGNRYYNPDSTALFSTGKEFGYDRVDLEQWRELTDGQDLDSVWSNN